MKRGLALAAMIVLLFNFGYSQKQKLSKEEAKQKQEETKKIKDELKNYMKHPEQYKAKMDEMQTNKDTADAQIARLNSALQAAQSDEADLQKKVAADDDQVKQLQEEAEKQKEVAVKEKESDLKVTPTTGTVFKVQLGLYNGFKVNALFDQAHYIGYEQVNGMNRYVVSYFPDSVTAAKFVADIRKFGVRDAFVAKYIDGQRVYEWNLNPKYKGKKEPATLDEALENAKPVKKGKKAKKAEE